MSHVDTAKTITHVSLCAGYGGIDLGLRRAIPSLRTIAYSEIEAYACANLVAKMEAGHLDAAPIWTDVKTFPYAEFRGRVDILSGGYPCQPFSSAGKRKGKDDPRHLWPWIADGIRAMRPVFCFFENVEGHVTLGLQDVLRELESIGYCATWGICSAAECGATHQRKRVFILAVSNGGGGRQDWLQTKLRAEVLEQSSGNSWPNIAIAPQQVWPSRPGEPQYEWEPPRVVGDARHKPARGWAEPGQSQHATTTNTGASLGNSKHAGLQGTHDNGELPGGVQFHASKSGGELQSTVGDAAQLLGNGGDHNAGERQRLQPLSQSGNAGWQADGDAMREAKPAMGGDADGPTRGMDYGELCVSCDNRTDELRLLGNGVVPATAERAFRVLMARFIK